ncbi:alginate O-acetyltransferase AlgX-related protein [Spirosoma gilvum]
MALGFSLFLVLPTLDQWFGFSAGFKSTEKNALTPRPVFHFPHVETYIANFNKYYKEHFGWRNALFYQYSRLKYTILGVSPLPEKVVLGKEGWFFPGNDMNHVADRHQGLLPFSVKELEAIAKRLSDKQRELAKQRMAFYVVISPDSYSIYPEYLPNYLKATRSTSNFDILKNYLQKHTTITLIDIRPNLIAAKSIHPTYLQTDSHWNDFGAFTASLAIINRIRQDFPNIPVPDEKSYHIHTKKGYPGDLVTMLALNETIFDKTNYEIVPPTLLQPKEIKETNTKAQETWPSQRFTSPNRQAPDLLFVGDSFTLTLRQCIPGYFSHTHIIRNKFLPDELVRSEKPDIVVFEIVERNLDYLANI